MEIGKHQHQITIKRISEAMQMADLYEHLCADEGMDKKISDAIKSLL